MVEIPTDRIQTLTPNSFALQAVKPTIMISTFPTKTLQSSLAQVDLSNSRMLSSTATGTQIVKAHTITDFELDITEWHRLLMSNKKEDEALKAICRGETNKSEAELEKPAADVAQRVLNMFPYNLYLVDKSDTGGAGETAQGPVPDAFVFPMKPFWEDKRANWWKYASFLVEYKRDDKPLTSNDFIGQSIQCF